MSEPKFRLKQLVMILGHNPNAGPEATSSDSDYRIDTGKVVKITKICPYTIGGITRYDYEIASGYQHPHDKVSEVWLRSLTGQEITGRI